MQFVGFALLVGSAVASRCPSTVEPQCRDLDFSRYEGLWYEQANSKAFHFAGGLTCVTANYSAADDGSVRVFNSGAKKEPTGEVSIAEGQGTVDDISTCRLKVKFANLAPSSPYMVWDTDYDTYSIVVTCLPGLNVLGQSAVWILSRVKQMPKTQFDSLLAKLTLAGFDYSDIRVQVQTSECNYYDFGSTMAV